MAGFRDGRCFGGSAPRYRISRPALSGRSGRSNRKLAGAAAPRLLTSDQWADYVIFRLYPRQRVFFDGRSDFYGPGLLADYRALMLAGPNWQELLKRYSFEAALLPRDWPLSSFLGREPGWREVYHDRVAVLCVREDQ